LPASKNLLFFTKNHVFGKIQGREVLARYLLLGRWIYLPGSVGGREMK